LGTQVIELSDDILNYRENSQNRTIKEIVGHMVDSASNNTHRIYSFAISAESFNLSDYANLGNNDRWISIQNYRNENWHDLVKLWKYSNLHIIHVINNVNPDKLDNEWIPLWEIKLL